MTALFPGVFFSSLWFALDIVARLASHSRDLGVNECCLRLSQWPLGTCTTSRAFSVAYTFCCLFLESAISSRLIAMLTAPVAKKRSLRVRGENCEAPPCLSQASFATCESSYSAQRRYPCIRGVPVVKPCWPTNRYKRQTIVNAIFQGPRISSFIHRCSPRRRGRELHLIKCLIPIHEHGIASLCW